MSGKSFIFGCFISMKRCLLYLWLIIAPAEIYAQFSDSVHHWLQATASGTFNRTDDGTTYLLNNGLKYGLRKKTFVMNLSNKWAYGSNAQALTNNDYTGTLDFNLYKTLPHFNYWGLVNFTSSFSLKIKSQVQTGVGIAYRFIDRANHMLSISDGILYERSNIIQEDQRDIKYATFRNSLRLQYRIKYRNLITFNATGFYQPSLQYGGDFIVILNANVGIKIWKWLSFSTALAYNNVSRTGRETTLLTYGLVAERFF
jgi:hypothetical protein